MSEFFITPANKLKTLIIPNEETQMVTVQIWFRAGSGHESMDQWGLAHFLEHMFFKGTKKRPDGQIMKEVESFGGEVNAFTSFDYTCYYINAPYTHWEQALDIILDMVSNPIFKDSDVKSEKMVVYEELMRANDNPSQFAFYHLQKKSFKGTYGHPILGTKKDILEFKAAKIKQFRKENYNINRCMLILGGKLLSQTSSEKIEKLISQYKLPNGPQASYAPFSLKKKLDAGVHLGPTPLANVTIVIQAAPMADSKAAMEELLISALTSGESAPILQELVYTNSLAQYFSTSTMYLSNGGVHFISFSAPVENLTSIYAKLKTFFHHICAHGVDQDLIDRTYQQFITSKIYDRESISSYSFPFGQYYALTNDPYFEKKIFENASKANSANSAALLKDIFSQNMYGEIQLPRETTNQEEHKLALRELLESIQTPQVAKNVEKKKIKGKVQKSTWDDHVEAIDHDLGPVLFRPNHLCPTFNMMLLFPGGLSQENSLVPNGAYYQLSNLISKGHGDQQYLDWKKYLEEHSISFDGFTGKNAWGISVHGQSKDFSSMLSHTLECLHSPNWTSQMLENEKQLTLRGIIKNEQDPVKVCFNEFAKLVFPNHHYGLSILGTKESLGNIHQDGLKSILTTTTFEKKGLLGVFGDVGKDSFMDQLHMIYEKNPQWAFGTKGLPNLDKTKVAKVHLHEPIHHFIELDREQIHIIVGMNAFHLGHTDQLYMKILTAYLNGPDSPLFFYIRDKLGLCYTIRAMNTAGIEGGSFAIYMATSKDRAAQGLSEIYKQLDLLAAKGLTKKQLQQSINLLSGQQMLGLNTNDDFMNTYTLNHYFGLGFDAVYKNLEKIKEMDYKKLNEFLFMYLKQHKIQVTVGPNKL